jgi:probable HAF family extracellular repeat protein
MRQQAVQEEVIAIVKKILECCVSLAAMAAAVACSGATEPSQEELGSVTSPLTSAYRIDAVPSLVSGGTSTATAINDNGIVAGSAQTSSSVLHAIRWAPGSKPVDLGALSAGNASAATGINASLAVVGGGNVTSVASHAFLYVDPGPMKDIGHLDFGGLSPNTQNVTAGGINDSGVIAGTSPLQLGAPTFSAFTRGFVWKAGKLTDLGSLGGSNSMASAINANGLVTGSTSTPTASEHAYSYNGVMTDIGVCPGASTSQGRAINAAGHIAGWCFFPQVNGYPNGHPADRHAFLWTPASGMRDLGSLGNRRADVFGIGSDDTVVGFMVNSAGARVAFIARAGGALTDLNTLIAAGSGWVLTEAHAINAKGQIAGTGTLNGVVTGFVLTPG